MPIICNLQSTEKHQLVLCMGERLSRFRMHVKAVNSFPLRLN